MLILVVGLALLLVDATGSSQPRRARAVIGGRALTSGLTRFSDPAAGFAISYPSDWASRATATAQLPLLVSSPGGAEALLVRVTDLGLTARHVTLRQLPDLLPLTNRLVNADPRAHLLQRPATVDLGGLPGYAYVYTEAAARGPRLAHVEYFLFSGPTMIALVFQVSRASRLTADGRALARIAATFTVPARR